MNYSDLQIKSPTPEQIREVFGDRPGIDWQFYAHDFETVDSFRAKKISADPFTELTSSDADYLSKRHVGILIGGDPSELAGAELMAAAAYPVALDVRIVRLNKLPANVAELVAMAEAAETYAPPAPGPIIQCLDDIEEKRIDWVWPNRIARGAITLLSGRPGDGKSTATMDWVARCTTGSPWPDGSGFAPKGSALMVTYEDDAARIIRQRARAHHADMKKIHLMSAVRRVGENGKPLECMYTLEDVHNLEESWRRIGDIVITVIDPVGSAIGGRPDANSDNEVRAVLAPISKLAEKYGVAVLIVAHRRKSGGGFADDLVMGSRGFTGIARCVYHISRDRQDKNRRLFLPGKNNWGPEGTGLAFTISGDPPAVCWEKDPVEMDADDGLAAENSNDEAMGPEPRARDAAAEWLREILAAGEVPAATIKAEAKAAGMNYRTVQRAADALGVIREKNSFSGGWQWRFPKTTSEVTDVA